MVSGRAGGKGHRVLRWAVLGIGVLGLISVLVDRETAPSIITNAPAQAALDAVATVIGLLAAYLMLGRYQQQRQLSYLVVFFALFLTAISNTLFGLLPVIALSDHGRLAPGLPGMTAGACFLLASLANGREISARTERLTAAVAVVALAGVLFASWFAWPSLIIQGTPSAKAVELVTITRTPGSVTVDAIAVAFFAAAAAGWTRRAEKSHDFFAAMLAVGTAMLAVSRLGLAFGPFVGTASVAMNSACRLGFYVALLAGSAYDIWRDWQRRTEVAVLEERRRIARELHDGLAQELSFIAAEARWVGDSNGQVLAAAAERALDDSRRAIAALTRPLDEALDEALVQTAEELSSRLGVPVKVVADPAVHVKPDVREGLVRIAREAVSNAGRHAHAARVDVLLSNGDGVRLTVVDDGVGFDPEQAATVAGAFGLTSMRERAAALGGTITIKSGQDSGTVVEVHIP